LACNHIFNGLLQLDDSLHIKPDIASLGLLAPCKNLYVLWCLFQKHILFVGQYTWKVTQDFEYSLAAYQMKTGLSWRMGFVKCQSFKAQNDSVFQLN
jgi:peptide/nickel transport system substrate-binding protein